MTDESSAGEDMKEGWLKKSLEESRNNVDNWPRWKRDLQDAIKSARAGGTTANGEGASPSNDNR